MKELIQKNKSVIKFMVLFFGCYLLLSAAYSLYLTYGSSQEYYPDYATHLVAEQSCAVTNALNYECHLEPHPNDPSMKYYVNGFYLTRVVEGCNAISVIILFISFIIAFHSNFKKTFLFVLAGTAIIYAMNLVRISLLNIGMIEYPKQRHFMHDTLFPIVIYGTVFLLWMLWVKIASKKKA